MTDIIGVRFKKACRIYYFDPRENDFERGEGVIVETQNGLEYGEVVIGRRPLDESKNLKNIKPVVRRATEEDYRKLEKNRQREIEAQDIFKEKVKKHGLEMKLISVEYAFDGSKITFSFTSDGRVDFRELVKDLASVFRTRIELRQVGVRDEAKLLGGLGPCGRTACCASFLNDFQPVSIKMAKEQSLSLSPTKISGLCGRLMCCLNYEQCYYEEMKRILPRVGAQVDTPKGRGDVTEVNPLKKTVKVRILNDADVAEIVEFSSDEIRFKRNQKVQEEKDIEISDELKELI